jgi:hypothetical protein
MSQRRSLKQVFIKMFSRRPADMGIPGGRGGGGGEEWAAAPNLLGKQSQSSNIRFTVGQYWLIIKINGTNSVNFVGNSANFVGNMLSNRNFS